MTLEHVMRVLARARIHFASLSSAETVLSMEKKNVTWEDKMIYRI